MNNDVVGLSVQNVAGVVPIKRPFPFLGGKLRAAYLFGNKYADHAPTAEIRAMGWKADWSEGTPRHIKDGGITRPDDDYWMTCGINTAVPMTPFNLGAFVDDPDVGVTLVAFMYTQNTSKAINLIRFVIKPYGETPEFNTATDAYIGMVVQPQTSGGRVLARATTNGSGGEVTAPLTSLTNEFGTFSMYAATFTSASRVSYAQAPGQLLRTGTPENTTKLLDGDGHALMGIESGSGAGVNRLMACAFYHALTPTELTDNVRADFGLWHSAIGSGITIL